MKSSRNPVISIVVMIVVLLSGSSFAARTHLGLKALLNETDSGLKKNIATQNALSSSGLRSVIVSFEAYDGWVTVDTTENGLLIPIFITVTDPEVELEGFMGLTIESRINRIRTARVTLEQLEALANHPDVDRIDPSPRLTPLTDVSAVSIGAQSIWNTYDAKGRGVIIGIVDNGIDFNNPDFINPDGTSRILYLWDQKKNDVAFPPPYGYTYGIEWSQSQILTQCTQDPQFHGTLVTGIAASNGRNYNSYVAANKYVGIAPAADIIFVNNLPYGSSLADAILYIAVKAHSLGKPWVISISQGTYFGPRNGTSPTEQFIEGIVNQYSYPGEGNIVLAAGNDNYDANDPIFGKRKYRTHAKGSGSGDLTLNIESQPTSSPQQVKLELWYPSQSNYSVSLTAPDGTIYGPIDPGCGTGTQPNCTPTGVPGVGVYYQDEATGDGFVFINNDFFGDPGTNYADPFPLSDERQIIIILQDMSWVDNNNLRHTPIRSGDWTISMSGSSEDWDAYIWHVGNSDQIDRGAFTDADNENSCRIIEPANAKQTITVGAYVNRVSWNNYQGSPYTYPTQTYTVGDRAPFSSQGPTRDGRMKPELMAPGAGIISTFYKTSGYFPSNQISIGLGSDINRGHYLAEGTSLAAPHVAGMIALILEKNPSLTRQEIYDCLVNNADNDNKIQGMLTYQCLSCCGLYTGGYPGNTNYDTGGLRNLADITKLIDRIYVSGTQLDCDKTGNVNGDAEGLIDLADIERLIDHVYITKTETGLCQ